MQVERLKNQRVSGTLPPYRASFGKSCTSCVSFVRHSPQLIDSKARLIDAGLFLCVCRLRRYALKISLAELTSCSARSAIDRPHQVHGSESCHHVYAIDSHASSPRLRRSHGPRRAVRRVVGASFASAFASKVEMRRHWLDIALARRTATRCNEYERGGHVARCN